MALAYKTHRPLLLSPDVVWITLVQGFAIHVRHNSEALRHRFVRHLGKKAIQLEVDRSWPDIVGRLVSALGQELGEEMTRLIECDFSTTGPAERMASRVVLLDVFQPYFDYGITLICGIPQVTLLGEAADWEQIRRRLEMLAAYDLHGGCSRSDPWQMLGWKPRGDGPILTSGNASTRPRRFTEGS